MLRELARNRLRSSLPRHRFLCIPDSSFNYSHSTKHQTRKIAILIDGDNAEASLIEDCITEAGRFGKVTVKRIYADWTSPQMKSWKDKLNSFAIKPMQKFEYTKSKNSTDTALIIDAMDLLHNKLVDGFCIVSSDSDYTGLAHRIREEGLFIMGIGKRHTPEAFVKACESFTFTEILSTPPTVSTPLSATISSAAPPLSNTIDRHLVEKAYTIAINIDTGYTQLSRLAEEMRKLDPSFDPRNHGFSTFRKFCEAMGDEYEVFFLDGERNSCLIKSKTNESWTKKRDRIEALTRNFGDFI